VTATDPHALAQLARFHALFDWCRGLGCCPWCAVGLAILGVEREEGHAFTAQPCAGVVDVHGRRAQCFDRARAAWATRPQREQPQIAA
jgi:hypothetical protein